MARPDEDEDAQVESPDDEYRDVGSESGEPAGEDERGRDDDSDVSAKRSDAGDDEGAPSSRDTAQPEAQQRTGNRYQRLANENREYRERLDRLERERQNEREQWQRQQQQLNEAQERDRLALMTPDEKIQYYIQQDRQQNNARFNQLQMQTAMQLDKSSYDAKAAVNPVYRRMADQVEAMFQEQLRKNQPTDRETILFHLIGKRAVNGAENSRPRQQARRRVENQRVAPTSGKGDTARRAETRMSTAEERLKDVLI